MTTASDELGERIEAGEAGENVAPVDAVVADLGVEPNAELAEAAGVGALVMKPFDLEVARTGVVVHATADAASGRLLGANMVGEEGVAHRVNAAAVAVAEGLTVGETGNQDLGYAPPVGPVWGPLLGVAKVLGEEVG